MTQAGIVQLLESTADAAFAIDARGIVRIWNTAATLLLGWRHDEVVGKEWATVLDGRGALGTSIGREVPEMVFAGHGVRAFDIEFRTRDGRRRWVRLSTLVHAPPRSHTKLVVFLAQDIQLQHVRDQLVDRMLGAADRLRALGSRRREPAVETMLARRVSRLLVVDRAQPSRMIGVLEWKGLARAWQRATEEERIRESSPRLGARLRLARRNRRRARRAPDAVGQSAEV